MSTNNTLISYLFDQMIENKTKNLKFQDLNGENNPSKNAFLETSLKNLHNQFRAMNYGQDHVSSKNSYVKILDIMLNFNIKFVNEFAFFEMLGIQATTDTVGYYKNYVKAESGKVELTQTPYEITTLKMQPEFNLDDEIINNKTFDNDSKINPTVHKKVLDNLKTELSPELFSKVSEELEQSFKSINKEIDVAQELTNLLYKELMTEFESEVTKRFEESVTNSKPVDQINDLIETLGSDLEYKNKISGSYYIMAGDFILPELYKYGKFTDKKSKSDPAGNIKYKGYMLLGEDSKQKVYVYQNRLQDKNTAILGFKQSNVIAPMYLVVKDLLMTTPIIMDPRTLVPTVAFMTRMTAIVSENIDDFAVKLVM